MRAAREIAASTASARQGREPGTATQCPTGMFAGFKEFLEDVLAPGGAGAQSAAPDLRLAAAVLLVEVMRAVDGISAAERTAGARYLATEFGLAPEQLATLLHEAERESLAAYDYFRFTHPLDRELTQRQKAGLVEAMWKVAFADGQADPGENAVISKVADLLHVPHAEYIAGKMRAKAAG
jgi:uncharacterized tellurite resistance protein B-like protein